MPIELGFILRRLAEMAEHDASLRDRQPWKAAYEHDYALARRRDHEALPRRRQRREGADRRRVAAFAGWTVEEYGEAAVRLPRRGAATRRSGAACATAAIGRWSSCSSYLEAHGFATYIASGGDRDFMRPVTEAIYGIPPERVVGSSNALRYQPDEDGGSVVYQAEPGLLRRRPGQARPHLEPDRAPAAARGRQLQRRPADAAVRRRAGAARPAPAGPPRRRRARVRLHRGRRARPRARRGAGLDRRQHASATGRPSSRRAPG